MKKVMLTWVGVLLTVASARGQIAPLHVGNTNSLVDEFGQLLQGTDPGAPSFGQTYVEGDLVQILRVLDDGGNYNVQVPATNGVPTNAFNQVIHSGRIGHGVDPTLGPVGKFGTAVTTLNRSGSQPIKLVARVFNAPSLDQASFYQDSELYEAANDGTAPYKVFIPQFTTAATTKPLDTSDHDGDGLSRSWEISYGSDPDNADSDGDGMPDGPEVRAGTDLNDADSLLMMVQIRSSDPSDVVLTWDAVTGKVYQVEYTTNDLAQSPVFMDINPPVAPTSSLAVTVITNGLESGATHFRIRLVE
jgi:hypothetical protein